MPIKITRNGREEVDAPANLYHATSMENLLSILKDGYLFPLSRAQDSNAWTNGMKEFANGDMGRISFADDIEDANFFGLMAATAAVEKGKQESMDFIILEFSYDKLGENNVEVYCDDALKGWNGNEWFVFNKEVPIKTMIGAEMCYSKDGEITRVEGIASLLVMMWWMETKYAKA